MSHRQHTQSTQLLRGVEDDRREPTGHLGVQPNLDSSLDLILTLDQEIQELLGVDDRLAVVRHQANEGSVPLVDDLERVTTNVGFHLLWYYSLYD